MGAFAIYPKHITFETQDIQEEIILLLRRHFFTNLNWIFISLIMIAIPSLLVYFPILDLLPASFQLFTLIIWYVLVLIYILENFLSWYFNVYIITDERLIDVDFYSLIYKRISEAKIDNIEDVTYSQGGFAQSILNYGTVTIQTAGEKPEFDFEYVPEPARVAKVLNLLMLQEEQEKIEGKAR